MDSRSLTRQVATFMLLPNALGVSVKLVADLLTIFGFQFSYFIRPTDLYGNLVQYGLPNSTTAAAGNQLGIFESGDHYSRVDLDVFFSTLYP